MFRKWLLLTLWQILSFWTRNWLTNWVLRPFPCRLFSRSKHFHVQIPLASETQILFGLDQRPILDWETHCQFHCLDSASSCQGTPTGSQFCASWLPQPGGHLQQDQCLLLSSTLVLWLCHRPPSSHGTVHPGFKAGILLPSSFPPGAKFFFVGKKDGSLCHCIDYRGLNAITSNNQYPLPLLNSAFKLLQETTIFCKLDILNAYHLICIQKGHEW